MQGWHIVGAKQTEDKTIEESFDVTTETKVMVTKAMITLPDALHFIKGEPANTVPGAYGIGIVSEPGQNLFDLKQGTRVYISPTLPCKKCFSCNNGEPGKCSDMQIAGENFNGFLRNFVTTESSNLYYLPESVSDNDALFIEHISLSLSIIDKLDIQKGDHIAIIGANNFGNILSQLLIYYQAVPILIDVDEENLQVAKNCGIYYTLGEKDNWIKEVSSITGGRMAKSVVYISDSDISPKSAFLLAGYNAHVAFTGLSGKNTTVSFANAVKKQLVIHSVNTGYGYTSSSINLIANKACNLKKIKFDECAYADVPEVFKNMAARLENNEKIYDTIVKISD